MDCIEDFPHYSAVFLASRERLPPGSLPSYDIQNCRNCLCLFLVVSALPRPLTPPTGSIEPRNRVNHSARNLIFLNNPARLGRQSSGLNAPDGHSNHLSEN